MSLESIQVLDGESLSAIYFFEDSIEMRFDYPILQLHAYPDLNCPGNTLSPGSLGYHDKFAGLIGDQVVSASIQPDKRMLLAFKSGVTLDFALVGKECGANICLNPGKDRPIQRW